MIIPALDLLDGKIVRLQQGHYNKKYIYSTDPYRILHNYENQGASVVHLVDLNAADNPNHKQLKLIKHLVNNSNISLQLGGGIRNYNDISNFLDIGIKRIVVGSLAIINPQLFKKILLDFGPDNIILALDVIIDLNNRKEVAINGWQKKSGFLLEEILEEFLSIGLRHVLCTDISCDGMMTGPNITLYKEIISKYPSIIFQSSGGVSSLNDIISLRSSKVQKVIIGRAFLENTFTIIEAIKCWQKE